MLGRDGTLAKSVAADSPPRGHAHAKTGTYFVENELDGTAVLTSKALAGYLETASGRSLIFAAFVNNVPLEAPETQRSVSDATARLAGCWESSAKPCTPMRRKATVRRKGLSPRPGERGGSSAFGSIKFFEIACGNGLLRRNDIVRGAVRGVFAL